MKKKSFVFRLSPSLQARIVDYLNRTKVSLAELLNQAMDRVYDDYSIYLAREQGDNALWKRSKNVLRLGTSIDKEKYKKLLQISELTSRSIADLVKEGIWKIINKKEG
jgi:predicted DNA-binding protein